ncbi:MAG: undecaprenyl-diphosphate phosphatase [Verrucomicrobiota bacterium]|nr:undecaprenyl-diphosphate phosphatase [Verrucomicrobiota bacterium]
MPAWLAVALLGLVEGLTEFIPVSSTGHLLLAEQWLPRQSEVFNVVIQCGAAFALLPVFAGRLRAMIFEWEKAENRDLALKLAVGFLITAIGGVILKKLHFKLPSEALPIAWATLIGGFVIVAVELLIRGKHLRDEITWPIAIAVGFAQLIAAIFPGASRSGTTIMMALLLGAGRPRATEFSFLIGIPTLLAAGALETFQQLRHAEPGPVTSWPMIFLGMLIAFVSAFVVVKWLLAFVRSHTFYGFAIYRIVLGIALLVFFWPRK